MKTEEKRKADCLQVMEQKEKSREQQVAEISLNPITLNTNTARVFSSGVFGELAITESIEVVRKMTDAVVQGSNLNELEELLTTQAVALNGIFNYLALRAHTNIGHYPETVEKYMKLALKAQAQCRSTIEAINEIKNPIKTEIFSLPNKSFDKERAFSCCSAVKHCYFFCSHTPSFLCIVL